MENRQQILSDRHILGKLNELGLTLQVMDAMAEFSEKEIKTFPVPHRCTVCSGRGNVPTGFYHALSGFGTTSNAPAEICKSCNGAGLVWSKGCI